MSLRVIYTLEELEELPDGAAIKSLLGDKPIGRTWGKVEGQWWGVALECPDDPVLPAAVLHAQSERSLKAEALREAADAFDDLPLNKGGAISSGTWDWFELFPTEHLRWRADEIEEG